MPRKPHSLPVRKQRDHGGNTVFDITITPDGEMHLSWEQQVHDVDGGLTDRVRNGEISESILDTIKGGCVAARDEFIAEVNVKTKKDPAPEPEPDVE